MFTFCVFTLLLIGFTNCNDEDLRRIDEMKQEAECTAAGGTCTRAVDCPPGHLTEETGLCPEQRSAGVECCYGLSTKETRCSKRGGHCVNPAETFCNSRLIVAGASDCAENMICCILV